MKGKIKKDYHNKSVGVFYCHLFSKSDNFINSLFVFLEDETDRKKDVPLKKRIYFKTSKLVPLTGDPFETEATLKMAVLFPLKVYSFTVNLNDNVHLDGTNRMPIGVRKLGISRVIQG